MGHRNIWIRKEDEAAWDALENKSQFIHDALGKGRAFEQLRNDPRIIVPLQVSTEPSDGPVYEPFE